MQTQHDVGTEGIFYQSHKPSLITHATPYVNMLTPKTPIQLNRKKNLCTSLSRSKREEIKIEFELR